MSKPKKNKKLKKQQKINHCVEILLSELDHQNPWTWGDIGDVIDSKDNSLIGSCIHVLKRSGVLRKNLDEPYFWVQSEYLIKLRNKYNK